MLHLLALYVLHVPMLDVFQRLSLHILYFISMQPSTCHTFDVENHAHIQKMEAYTLSSNIKIYKRTLQFFFLRVFWKICLMLTWKFYNNGFHLQIGAIAGVEPSVDSFKKN